MSRAVVLDLLQVSVMMQYFKRPWNIQEYIARLQACQVRTCQQQAIDVGSSKPLTLAGIDN